MNSYDASGRKLAARNFTNVVALSQPLNEGDVLKHVVDQYERVYINTVHNIGNIEYNSLTSYNFSTASAVESFQSNKLYNSEGYARDIFSSVTNPDYYYFCRDHLGNIREVWQGYRRTVVQRTQYYPSGLPWASNSSDNPSLQSRKYNGKEFVEMHGLDEYDSEARWYYPAIMRTTTIDPLAEKYYSISPYAWCGNNPVRMVDLDGMSHYSINPDGKVVLIKITNDKFDNLYVVDSKGNVNNKIDPLKINDQSILSGLTMLRRDGDSFAVTSSSEVGKVFIFVANNSNVEWSLLGVRSKNGSQFIIGTSGDYKSVDSPRILKKAGFSENNLTFDLHSHPGTYDYKGNLVDEGTRGASNTRAGGDMHNIIEFSNNMFKSGRYSAKNFPKHFVYHRQSKTLYQYTPYESSLEVGKVSSNLMTLIRTTPYSSVHKSR